VKNKIYKKFKNHHNTWYNTSSHLGLDCFDSLFFFFYDIIQVDLAKGHVAALAKLYSDEVGCRAVNLGTGQGVSVLELVEGMSKATGKPVPYQMAPRRPGDVATMYADPRTAEELLGWKATLGVDDMCADTWRWQSTNPYGYKQVEALTE
jgi:UDP-glucose 4-epimerase